MKYALLVVVVAIAFGPNVALAKKKTKSTQAQDTAQKQFEPSGKVESVDDDTVDNMMKHFKDPEQIAKMKEMMKDPEAVKHIKEMMSDPGWQKQAEAMKKKMGGAMPDFSQLQNDPETLKAAQKAKADALR